MSGSRLFTAESVAEGRPDKLAGQISDAVLDALLREDANARVACETLVKTGMVLLAGEVRSSAVVDLEPVVREVVREIGYTSGKLGFDSEACAVLNALGQQSADIAMGVDETDMKEQGAGDQGLMFGYATDETDVLMPAPVTYSHRLRQRQAEVRKNGTLPWPGPAPTTQLSVLSENGSPAGIETVVLSTQHAEDVPLQEVREAVIEEIVKPVLPEPWLGRNVRYLINPTGRFVTGGPHGDCGMTGRKIIVDTYGGAARHGGGAFSGKDPSKVDRSASYAARHIAKNLVAAGIARRCEVQLSYAIGVAEPTSISVETFGTGSIAEARIIELVEAHFELRPKGLIEQLDLLRPIYRETARFGHFGREDAGFSWERTDLAEILRDEAGSACSVQRLQCGEER